MQRFSDLLFLLVLVALVVFLFVRISSAFNVLAHNF